MFFSTFIHFFCVSSSKLFPSTPLESLLGTDSALKHATRDRAIVRSFVNGGEISHEPVWTGFE